MSGFRDAVSSAYAIMQIPVNVCGYTVTCWQLFLFFAVASVLLTFLFGIFK